MTPEELAAIEKRWRNASDPLRDDAPALHAALREAWAEAGRLREVVAKYDGVISWDTTCANCAHLLDECYAETMRAEAAEAEVERLRIERETLREWQVQHGMGLGMAEHPGGHVWTTAPGVQKCWCSHARDHDESPLTLAREAEAKAEAAIDRVRALHNPRPTGPKPEYLDRCDWCHDPYPCATIRALDGDT